MKLFIFFLLLIGITYTAKGTINESKKDTTLIYMKDYGLEKTRKKDGIKFIKKALKDINGDQPKKLIFSRGTYHFYPDHCEARNYYESNTTDINPKVCAFLFEKVNNLVIDGNGSTLIFHGQMQPFTFDSCTNITLQNVSIDWENPLIAQGEVLKITDQYIDLGINANEFPHHIEDGKLVFDVYGGKTNNWKGTMEFDRTEKYIVPQTGDWGCLGRNWQDYIAETTMPGIVRLHHDFTRKPKTGNFLVLRHAERAHSGVFIKESKNVTIQNLNLYHATGLGILAQFSEDLTFNGYRAIPNEFRRHYFGGGDDGLQVSNCKGQVTVTNCEFAGLMDDPINVHGTSVQVQEIISEKEVKCKFMHNQSVGLNWGHNGDKISFIENEGMFSLGTGNIKKFTPIDSDNFILTFNSEIPKKLEVGDAIENLTWSPDFTVKDSQFKNCRARGLLVSTPGKVIIENNIFESSGSAILIAGDANGWFESGAVTDVLIKNNTFTDLCNTSSYQFCEGIISIYPIIPKLDENTPAFHKNIRIDGNRFNPFDYPLLFARSTDSISFTNNTVTRSYNFEPYHDRQFTFTFESCKNITLTGNTFSDDLLGKNVLLIKTDKNELHSNVENIFDIQMY